jgi:hypothetical protein
LTQHTITHPELVQALVKPGTDILKELTASSVDLWHAVTGVMGEATEIMDAVVASVLYGTPIDKENIFEEMGDMEFYLQQFRSNRGIHRDETLITDSPRSPALLLAEAAVLTVASGNLLDFVKKSVVYNKPIENDVFCELLGAIEVSMANLRVILEIKRCATLDGNISKLSIRYAGMKYTDDDAQFRADKA